MNINAIRGKLNGVKRLTLRLMARIKRPTRRQLLASMLGVLCFTLGCGAGVVAVVSYYQSTLPPIGPLLEGYDPPQTTRVVSADGVLLAELFEERRTVVPLQRIPKVMVDAVLAAEDADFRTHGGLDYSGIARAVWTNLWRGRLSQGASTITQQVARTFFLGRERTFSRKIREILLTFRLEDRLTKDEILFLYLNQINFGHARYGVQEASWHYFATEVSELTLPQAALLAGLPKGPGIYSPLVNRDKALARRNWVLSEMQRRKMIAKDEESRAADSPIELSLDRRVHSTLAPEVVALALSQAVRVVGEAKLKRGGLRIETTVDLKLEQAARKALLHGLQAIDARHHRLAPLNKYKTLEATPTGEIPRPGKTYVAEVVGHDDAKGRLLVRLSGQPGWIDAQSAQRYNPKGLAPSKLAPLGAKLPVSLEGNAQQAGSELTLRLEIGPQAALIALSVQTGQILAVVGGDRVIPGGFDRATAARRQPGSTFKPFVYLAALDSGRYTAATLLDDAPEVQGEWQPSNSHPEQFEGSVRLRTALARSLNLPAVKVATDIGPEVVSQMARRVGISSRLDPTPSLSLGSSAVSLLEMASSYGVFSALGKRVEPWIIKRITTPEGRDWPMPGRTSMEVISEAQAALMTSLLRSVVEEGTGTEALDLGRPAAGKTGTSDEQRDAWFVGYTPQISCAVWVGYDDLRSIGKAEFGAKAALPIWLEFMKFAHEGLPEAEFPQPEGLVTVRIDPKTGLLAYDGMEGALEEWFIDGTEPTETAVPPELVAPSDFLLEQAADAPQPTAQGSASPSEAQP
ncbi:MAG: PBP1A family penicillin-binding protein [Myxococcota bacterium]|nr:PBP1A family penicillin-binding protein [Myxococcota bacterium]